MVPLPLGINRRVRTIRDLQLPIINRLLNLAQPLLPDRRKHGSAVLADEERVRNGLGSPDAGGVEDSRVRGVEETILEVGEGADLVFGLFGDDGEDVCADVVTTEGVEVPDED
jgi:hypothetical protein